MAAGVRWRITDAMNLVDLGVLAIIGISALLGLSRGFVRELLGLGSWVLAAYAAWQFGPQFIPMAQKLTANPDIAEPLAYAGSFIAVLIVLSLLANLVGQLVRVSALGGLDRTLGLLFGIARGALVLVAAYIPVAQMLSPDKWPPLAVHARTLPWIYDGAVAAANEVPPQYRPRVPPAPGGTPATADDLLHATPEGRALGARPTPPI